MSRPWTFENCSILSIFNIMKIIIKFQSENSRYCTFLEFNAAHTRIQQNFKIFERLISFYPMFVQFLNFSTFNSNFHGIILFSCAKSCWMMANIFLTQLRPFSVWKIPGTTYWSFSKVAAVNFLRLSAKYLVSTVGKWAYTTLNLIKNLVSMVLCAFL